MSEGNVNSDEREISLFVMEVIDTGVGKNNCFGMAQSKDKLFFLLSVIDFHYSISLPF